MRAFIVLCRFCNFALYICQYLCVCMCVCADEYGYENLHSAVCLCVREIQQRSVQLVRTRTELGRNVASL